MGAVGYERGDCFLLCTDGLIGGFHDAQIEEFLRGLGTDTPADSPASRMVDLAVSNDGRDNTTALILRAK